MMTNKLFPMWLVRSGGPHSTLDDMVMEIVSEAQLARYIIGTGLEAFIAEQTKLYTERHEAVAEAGWRMAAMRKTTEEPGRVHRVFNRNGDPVNVVIPEND